MASNAERILALSALGLIAGAVVKAALDGRGRQEVQLPSLPPKLLLKPAPRPAGRLPTPIHPPVNPAASVDEKATVRAARRLNCAAGLLAVSVLADSAVEHYRGSFQNRAMVTPLAVALSLGISAHGRADPRRAHRGARPGARQPQ